ncbi:MAG: pyridoxine 5'-phosphate synthase [Rhodospirillaceae bacterium]|nr:pyridoxine 5'-phosphate synthase [Rhodospirillaceae bacterium]
MTGKQRLGVNIDHVAPLRNARGVDYPDPLRAAKLVEAAGGDGITAHLREDRRHIRDDDIARLMDTISLPLNLEMAATDEMVEIALHYRPHACCLVPEKRAELTTEGGLDVAGLKTQIGPQITRLNEAGIRVSLFIDPTEAQLEAAIELGAPVVELHTGAYCDTQGAARKKELARIKVAAAHGARLGLECHAGHGLTFDTVGPVAAIPNIVELNIGHFLIGEAVFTGLDLAIKEMRNAMDVARAGLRKSV